MRLSLGLLLAVGSLIATPTRRAPATNQPMVDDYKITVLSG